MRSVASLIAFTLLISCTDTMKEQNQAPSYFDIAGLMETQIEFLVAQNASVQKSSIFNGVADTDVIKPDSAGWRTELQSIIDMDINKPVLKGRYEVIDNLQDESSNLKIRELRINDEEEAGVNKIQIYYLKEVSEVRKIKIERREKNPLYHSKVYVTVEFDDAGGSPMIDSYSMQGYQKMIFMDSAKYEIEGTIIL